MGLTSGVRTRTPEPGGGRGPLAAYSIPRSSGVAEGATSHATGEVVIVRKESTGQGRGRVDDP